jgi:ubiquinone/menaquinone biosynthesis C-methylase UbiE
VTFLSPLGYLVGVEGVALLRGFREGTADRAFVETRLAEIRRLLDTPALAQGVAAAPGAMNVDELYRDWAPHYDEPGNALIDLEQPVVRRILDGLPAGTALDAACGTGRHAEYLRRLGHRVIGVDGSPEMLAQARRRLPDVELHDGDLNRLPLADGTVDVVLCALALSYVPDLRPVFAEFARVLRPGGHLVVSDLHVLAAYLGPTLAHRPGRGGDAATLVEHHRPLSDYLAAALPLGFQVRHCEEPRRQRVADPRDAPDTPATEMSWGLLYRCPEAAAAALGGSPAAVVWHFQLDEPAGDGPTSPGSRRGSPG